MKRLVLLSLILITLLSSRVNAAINSHSDGSDGALNVGADKTIDLSRAIEGSWDQASTSPGDGVYDASKWAVVFKYSSVNITSGTVWFKNHPSGAPVVWLVQGDVTITGAVSLGAEAGLVGVNRESVPGPGGFPGGRATFSGSPATAGHGPGGGAIGDWMTAATNGSHATGPVPYGNNRILPLMGGSGGGGNPVTTESGAAGGGAILIVVGGKLTLEGGIFANGGCGNHAGSGSGGSIRLIADTLVGTSGQLSAIGCGDVGGLGRIRLETNSLRLATQSQPAYSLLLPLGPGDPVIWPPDPVPTARIATVNGFNVTSDPRLDPTGLVNGDVTIAATQSVPVTIACSNVPTNATVSVRVVLGAGDAYTVPATFSTGNAASSTWTATLTTLTPARVSSLQARVELP